MTIGGFLAILAGAWAIALAPPPTRRLFEQSLNFIKPNEILTEADLIELKRRGLIDEDFFKEELRRQGISAFRANLIEQISKALLQVEDLINLRIRGKISKEEYLKRARHLGFDEDKANKLFSLVYKRLPPEVVIRGIWRGIKFKKGIESYKQELREQGWTDDRIEVLEKTARFYPSVDDFIRFLVRDSFNEEIVKKYGYDEDYPKQIEEFVKKAGVDPEWMRHYWRSHWELPSPTQAYEMLHRGLITKEDMDTLLKIADYPKFWREKLIGISYSPLTRVDVRRMHKLGILDEEGVKRSYMDLGYNERNAELMTKFTIEYNKSPEEAEKTEEDRRLDELKGLTRSSILRQYEKRLIDRETAKSYLKDIGLSDEVAEFYLNYTDYKIEEDRLERETKRIELEYKNGIISYNDAVDQLGKLNVSGSNIEELLREWEIERMAKPAQPSKSELIKMVQKGIISIEQFTEKMLDLGYSLKYIEWYKRLYNIIPA